MYKIIDCQNKCYLHGEEKTLKDCRERLISFHSIDVDNNWLNSMSLEQICAEFDWDIEKQKPFKNRRLRKWQTKDFYHAKKKKFLQ